MVVHVHNMITIVETVHGLRFSTSSHHDGTQILSFQKTMTGECWRGNVRTADMCMFMDKIRLVHFSRCDGKVNRKPTYLPSSCWKIPASCSLSSLHPSIATTALESITWRSARCLQGKVSASRTGNKSHALFVICLYLGRPTSADRRKEKDSVC